MTEYSTIRPKDVGVTKEWVKKSVKNWHDKLHPEVIFLVESSATPAGYLIRETWKNMYPSEASPKFYRIDSVSILRDFHADPRRGWKKKDELKITQLKSELADFFSKRLPHGKETRVLVYDHNIDQGDTKRSTDKVFLEYAGLNPNNYLFETGISRNLLSEREGSVVNSGASRAFDTDNPKNMPVREEMKGKIFRKDELSEIPRYTFDDIFESTKYVSPTMKKSRQIIEKDGDDLFVGPPLSQVHGYAHPKLTYNFRGRIVKHPEARKRALAFIRDLKKLGREAGKEAGQEIKQEQEKKKSLEGKVTSIISLGTLAGAIGFLSSNITGNTIANLSVNASSSIGIALFAIAVLTGLFYVKSKL